MGVSTQSTWAPASTYRTYNQPISDLSSYSASFSSTPVNRKAPHRVSWKEEDSSFEEYSIDIASLERRRSNFVGRGLGPSSETIERQHQNRGSWSIAQMQ